MAVAGTTLIPLYNSVYLLKGVHDTTNLAHLP
jgi:hypothetical protein